MFSRSRHTHLHLHRSRSAKATPAIESLEPRIAPATLVGLTSRDVLVTFDSGAPGKILTAAKIAGLAMGENVVSLDARPADGLLYGLTNKNTLYTLNPYTGAATQVGIGPAAFPLTGKTFAVGFNPSVDRLRIVSDADLSFRLNPNTGAIVDGDGAMPGTQPDASLAYDGADVNKTKNPAVTAIAYDRNFQGTTLTTLYGIDSTLNTLVRIGGIDGTPSPNLGTVFTVGALGTNPQPRLGFEIAPDGTAYAAMQVGSRTSLFTIDLGTGAATVVGKIHNGALRLDAIAALPFEEVVVGVTLTNKMVTFRASDPGTLLANVQITGLAVGEVVTGIDFRPSTGELIGVTSFNNIVSIDRSTGRAISRGTPLDIGLFATGGNNGLDFNPVVDRLRIVNQNNDDLRYNPVTFQIVDSDGSAANGVTPDADLAYIATDTNVGANPDITGAAYDRNDLDGATASTLFVIDSTLNILARQGAVDGSSGDVAGGGTPNGGLLTTLGSLGVDPTELVGFDISSDGRLGKGVALASMQLNGETSSKLFVINTQSGLTNQAPGTATLIGTIGGGQPLAAMAIAPATIQFTTSNTVVKEKAGTFAVVEISRTGGSDIAASVVFNTSDGSATAGLDYTALANQVITFAPGESLKRIMIPILGDKLAEFNETINLQLTNVLGGNTRLGDTINAVATIQGKKFVF